MRAILTILIGIGTTILRGYILSMMWGWFVLTQFPSAPRIGVVGAIGLSCLIGLFHMHSLTFSDYVTIGTAGKTSKKGYQLYSTMAMLAATLATWLVAFIVHLFM